VAVAHGEREIPSSTAVRRVHHDRARVAGVRGVDVEVGSAVVRRTRDRLLSAGRIRDELIRVHVARLAPALGAHEPLRRADVPARDAGFRQKHSVRERARRLKREHRRAIEHEALLWRSRADAPRGDGHPGGRSLGAIGPRLDRKRQREASDRRRVDAALFAATADHEIDLAAQGAAAGSLGFDVHVQLSDLGGHDEVRVDHDEDRRSLATTRRRQRSERAEQGARDPLRRARCTLYKHRATVPEARGAANRTQRCYSVLGRAGAFGPAVAGRAESVASIPLITLAMPIPTDSERIGTTIDGKYRVEALIGKGGMGTVFRAKHTWTGRSVALKVLQPQYAENDAVVLRFLREARAAASFRHPNVVEVLDMGALPEGGAYMALAFLEGESLAAVIERRARLTVEESYASLVPVMRALSLAHGKGIIHRDIKPDNLFMARTDDGAVVPTLLDFGIAKLIDDSGKSTTTGVIFGTPQYMSPEQARGVSDIDGRADVWSVAAVWYECLTGSPPFDAPVPTAVIARILSERATPVLEVRESIPRAIAACIDRGLEPDRSARYASMDDFIDALLEAAAKERVELSSAVLTVRRAEPPERTDAHRSIEAAKTLAASEVPTMTGPTEKPARLQRWTVALGALAFAVVVGFAIVPRGGASTRAARRTGRWSAGSRAGRRLAARARDGERWRRSDRRRCDDRRARARPMLRARASRSRALAPPTRARTTRARAPTLGLTQLRQQRRTTATATASPNGTAPRSRTRARSRPSA
jgi:serine/threonine protein kinase